MSAADIDAAIHDVEHDAVIPDPCIAGREYLVRFVGVEVGLTKGKGDPGDAEYKSPSPYLKFKCRVVDGPSANRFLVATLWLPKREDVDRPSRADGCDNIFEWKVQNTADFFGTVLNFPISAFPISPTTKRRIGFAQAAEMWAAAALKAQVHLTVQAEANRYKGKVTIVWSDGTIVKPQPGWSPEIKAA